MIVGDNEHTKTNPDPMEGDTKEPEKESRKI